jgi:hypothetical protein
MSSVLKLKILESGEMPEIYACAAQRLYSGIRLVLSMESMKLRGSCPVRWPLRGSPASWKRVHAWNHAGGPNITR